ncbi:MAG TPA: FAD:protein FMN transferase [Solirubrobacteraceae bacterium]|nr:FAD:protein FMN transferase [Solirubrobacteraceae bacterium]
MPATEHEHSFELFGTRLRVLVSSAMPLTLATQLITRRVKHRLQAIHRELTRFEPSSELNHLNAHAGEPVRVSETLLEGVQGAPQAARLSDGLVDPTVLSELERAGYATSRVGISPAPLADALRWAPPRSPAGPGPAAEWKRIHVDADEHVVRLPRGVRLDLGGSAKGMAVDLAAQMIAANPAFAIDAGGDIRIGGAYATPRTVEIAHPLRDQPAHNVTVTAGAVATSGLRTRVWRAGDGFAHHLIDPARGVPAWTGVIQATALAPTALEAETLAKMALLSGPLAGRAALERHGGALILDSGKLILLGELDTRPGYPTVDRLTA